MKKTLSVLFKIRALCTAATILSACGPTASHVVLPAYHHPLLHHQTDFLDPSPSHEGPKLAHLTRSSAPRRFSHPLLNKDSAYRVGSWIAGDPIENRLAVARQARKMLASGSQSFRVGDRVFRHDCSGFVLAVLAARGIRISRFLDEGRGGGVAAIYRWADSRGLIHHRKVPAIGDLVFFDNTYDRNRDGRLNDALTHIGIVERVDPDGTISIIHHVRRGVLRYKLNRFQPRLRRDPKSGKVLNNYLRVLPRGSKPTGQRLTGELFHAFATIIR